MAPHHQGKEKAFEEDKKLIFQPGDLNIVWGGDARYWDVDQNAAKLLQVCWLEVTGSATNINPKKDYDVIFQLSFTPDAFGWDSCPVYIMVKRGKKGPFAPTKYQLTKIDDGKEFEISGRSKADKEKESKELYFGLYEVWSGKWKGGLKIHNVTVKESRGN